MIFQKIFCFIALVCMSFPLYAQPNFKGNAFTQSFMIQEETVKVFVGPSSAYNSKAKLFKGNIVKILKLSADQKWAEIQSGDIKGWVVVSFLAQAENGTTDDAGRIEKKNDYQYDENGRRIQGGIGLAGSGEGTQRLDQQEKEPNLIKNSSNRRSQSIADPNEITQRPAGFKPVQFQPYFFRLSLLPGITLLKREFSSDISFNSPLQKLVAQGNVYQTNLKGELIFSDYIGLVFNVQDARMNFELAAHPYSLNPKNTTISMERQNFNTMLAFSYPVKSWTFSWVTGLQIQRSYVQQIKESSRALADLKKDPNVSFAPLLQQFSLILPIGTHIKYQISTQLYTRLEAGIWLPLSLTQAPLNTGKWNGLGFWTDLVIGYDLSDMIGLLACFQWNYLVYAFEGPGTQFDTIAQQSFLNSMSADISLGASLGISLRF